MTCSPPPWQSQANIAGGKISHQHTQALETDAR